MRKKAFLNLYESFFDKAGWKNTIGGYLNSDYCKKTSRTDGYAVFAKIDAENKMIELVFDKYSGLQADCLLSKLFLHKDLPKKEKIFIDLFNSEANLMFKKGQVTIKQNELNEDFQ